MATHGYSGHAAEECEWLARVDPDYEAARRRLADCVWTSGKPALEPKYRELMGAVVLGYRTYPTVDAYLRRALSAGATLREILEAFEAAAVLGGFTMLHYTLPYLIALHDEFGDEIIDGRQEGSRREQAQPAGTSTGPVSRGMREWAWLDKIDPDYDAARRYLTRGVWNPTNPALPIKVREMAASAILAYRAFPTVDGHLRRAIREGASVAELVEAMQAAADPGGFPLLHYAMPFLARLRDEIEAGTFA